MRHVNHKVLSLVASLALAMPCTSLLLPAQEPVKVDSRRLVGVINFRDIGGYKTKDGHTIRYNMIYRSGELATMTPADHDKLAPLKIRYEIDLRTPGQRAQAPTHWGANPPQEIDIPFCPIRSRSYLPIIRIRSK